jgi:hypothetical protein
MIYPLKIRILFDYLYEKKMVNIVCFFLIIHYKITILYFIFPTFIYIIIILSYFPWLYVK